MRMMKLLAPLFALAMLGCEGRVMTEQNVEALRLQRDYDTACSEGKCPCASPLGLIVHGGTAVAYNAESVACGTTCESQKVLLTCQDGKFDRDISTIAFSCSVENCKACTVGNNQVPHGFTATLYKSTTVACGTSCEDAKRALVCFDGKLQSSDKGPAADGSDAQYVQGSCQPSSCSCDLPSGGKLSLGGSLKFYKSSTGTCTNLCDDPLNVQMRSCVNTGTAASPTFAIGGDTTYRSMSCTGPTAAQCDCVLPDPAKSVIHHGESATLYTTATPYNCLSCASQKLAVFCGSGVLYDKPITDPAKAVVSSSALNSHPALTCDDLKTKDCYVNGHCVADGKSRTLYGKSTLVCGDDLAALTGAFSCTTSSLFQNGKPYSAATDSYATTWQISQPTNTCVGCRAPWGISVQVGKSVTAFKSSVESSNTCGGGCKSFELTCTATPGGNVFKSGDPLIDADVVTNAKLYKAACDNVCNQEGGGAPPRACLLPWQNSFVSADSLVPMWRKKTVACGDSCQNYYRLGKCQMGTGTFDAGLDYIYQSCSELPCGSLKVSSISPTFLPPAGGRLQITGTGFSAGMTISIGLQSCQSISVASATSASCTVPAGTALYQDVSVKSGTEKAVLPQSFSFYSGTCASGPGVKVFTHTGGMQSFAVPSGCAAVSVSAWGAGGAGRVAYGSGGAVTQFGGSGGFSKGRVAVAAGQVLGIVVGGGGQFIETWGSGGGGLSGVFSSTVPSIATAVLIAGGGGGAGDPLGCNGGSTGGEGGGTTGGTHGACSGLGGTQTAGGNGGPNAAKGAALLGGSGPQVVARGGYLGGGGSGVTNVGGGGGSGYYGGGAGTDGQGLNGAGGGGSGFLSPSVTGGSTLTGSGRYPPGMKESRYQSGIGQGGGRSAGGAGLVVVEW